ncbi:hypothetical protein CAOG_08937 [Capsaspora owczarzaki ATCC 30864]|uniref:hypothetical protein n=1 Tax=Capsaspora owczarzaki (strain ATCC 30864) TaxID=595528 RepID=UPI000352111D|nr:hypothetical protein CAOG_08937 [Capsaspora owczarzaki ATCC 30864]|eukprot:XP_011270608.1 hypothetical protein CAOG_08937 [Capsaspora owczarzaki ATCC 30864]
MRRRPGTNTGIRNLTKSTCTRAAPRRAAHDPAGLDCVRDPPPMLSSRNRATFRLQGTPVPQRPFVVPSSPAADCLLGPPIGRLALFSCTTHLYNITVVWSRGYRAGSGEAAGPKAQMRQSSEPDSGPPERAAPFLL